MASSGYYRLLLGLERYPHRGPLRSFKSRVIPLTSVCPSEDSAFKCGTGFSRFLAPIHRASVGFAVFCPRCFGDAWAGDRTAFSSTGRCGGSGGGSGSGSRLI